MSTLLVGAGTGAATALSFAPATVQDLVREYWTAALALVGLCLLGESAHTATSEREQLELAATDEEDMGM
jgi:hypothetical protein